MVTYMARPMRIKKNPEKPVPVDVMEQAIVEIAARFKKLNASRLSRRAIVLLVQDAAGAGLVSRSAVEAVLDAAQNLDKYYLKSANQMAAK